VERVNLRQCVVLSSITGVLLVVGLFVLLVDWLLERVYRIIDDGDNLRIIFH